MSAWQRLQALGDLKAIVAAGVGGSMEWSVRPMAAKRVMGMWHAMQSFPLLPARVVSVRSGIIDLFLMARGARHVRLARPRIAVFRWEYGNGCSRACPIVPQGLIIQEV